MSKYFLPPEQRNEPLTLSGAPTVCSPDRVPFDITVASELNRFASLFFFWRFERRVATWRRNQRSPRPVLLALPPRQGRTGHSVETRHPRKTESEAVCSLLSFKSLFFWSTCLSSLVVFLHFPFDGTEEWKKTYCILTRVNFPLEVFFFFFFFKDVFLLLIFICYLDSLSFDLASRPERQRHYYVEMCSQNTEENDQHQSFL